MKQYVSIDKRSKKAKKEYYSKQRITWGELNPATKSFPNGKAYNRKKEKQRAFCYQGHRYVMLQNVI